MANFNLAFTQILINEGRYSNHPNDRGGETYCGIARIKNPFWPGWKIIDLYKESTSFPQNIEEERLKSLVFEFYKKQYWDRISGDAMNNDEIAQMLFDIAVNMGTKTAGVFIQKILNLLNRNEKDYKDVYVDGVIGSKTINALNILIGIRGQWIILYYLFVQMGAKWITLASNDPKQEAFMNGWGNRAIKNIKLIADKHYEKEVATFV